MRQAPGLPPMRVKGGLYSTLSTPTAPCRGRGSTALLDVQLAEMFCYWVASPYIYIKMVQTFCEVSSV